MRDPDDAELADETPEARFGSALRGLRVRAGLSVRRLAEELHRSHSSVVEYERGRRLPGVEVVEQYEDYFGLQRGTLGMQRERARLERLEDPRDATVEEHLGEVACPYKGLCAFEYEDAALYFGREGQVERVLARLSEVRFVAVVGASGSGKSSFVRAGLLAGIRAAGANGGATPRIALLTPGARPLDELATCVSAVTGGAERVLADDLRADPGRLGHAARQGGGRGLVVVVDQFEELFTLCDDETERRCFVDALIGAWRDPSSPVTVVVALRADFYGRVASYPSLAAAVVAQQALIGPMSQADLRRAIELPAARTGLVLQPGLVETILEDLAGEPGALPLLSHALLETWKRRRRLMLTVGGYREAGGVRSAIAQTAERTLHSMPQADQTIARAIFLRLTDVGEGAEPTRRRVDRAELAAHPQATAGLERVFGILADARLVTIDERTVVVAHEALIRHWPRLRGWVDADRAGLLIHRRISDAAREWDSLQREPSALYRGARLASAHDWATDHEDDLSHLERDFLTASHAAEHGELEAARRRSRRLRSLAAGSVALAAIVAVLAAWALGQREDARQQAAQATSLALASAASPLRESRPDVSLLLSMAAYRTSPRPEAQSGLHAALTAALDPGVRAIMHGHVSDVMGVAFSPDRRTLASTSGDKTIRLWDVRTHKQVGAPLTGHSSIVWGAAFGPGGSTLASASNDGTVRLWDARTHRQVGAPLTGHTNSVYDVAFSPDGHTLASTGADRTVRLWDVRTHRRRGAPLTGHTAPVWTVAFSPDGRVLASAGDDATVRLWDVRTHRPRGAPLAGHTSRVHDVAFSADGRTLASANDDRTVRLWDVRTHRQVGAPLTGHTNAVRGVAFSPDGRMLATASDDRTVRLWNARNHRQVGAPLAGHANTVWGVAFSPDGRTLASTSDDRTVRLWDARPRRHAGAPLAGHANTVRGVAFSPDGRTLASVSDDRTLRLWDARIRKPLGSPLTGHTSRVFGVAFSPDGRMLASAGDDATVRLWDARTHRQVGGPLTGHTIPVWGLAFSPDGRKLVSAGADGTVRLWDMRTRRQVGAPLAGHTRPVWSVAFSPDGRTLASASSDRTVRLWDARTHKPLGVPLAGHTGTVWGVAFSPDGRTLASASDDTTVRVWDARTRKPLGAPLTGHAGTVHDVAFSPDGRTLASTSADKTIRLWDMGLRRSFAALQKRACHLVGSGLSRAEWAQYATGIPYRTSCP